MDGGVLSKFHLKKKAAIARRKAFWDTEGVQSALAVHTSKRPRVGSAGSVLQLPVEWRTGLRRCCPSSAHVK